MAAQDYMNSIQSFTQCLNADMTLSLAKKVKMSDLEIKELKSEIVEKLISASRYEQAGDLVDPI